MRRTILVAEGDDALRMAIVSRLRVDGHIVYEATHPAHVGDVAESATLHCAVVGTRCPITLESFDDAVMRHLVGRVRTLRVYPDSSDYRMLGEVPGDADLLIPNGQMAAREWKNELSEVVAKLVSTA